MNPIFQLIPEPASVRISHMDAVIIGRIAIETAIPESSVSAAVALLQNGAAGPFIARYRKEATGELDETKIRIIQDRLAHYREAMELRADLLKMLTEQGALTDELQARIDGCLSKTDLEDMQRRFRPRKKTRAIEAVEKGLHPLAEYFWKQESDGRGIVERLDVFVDPARGVLNREQALQGVVDILAEWIWEKAEYRQALREMLWSEGHLVSAVVPAKVGQKTKYNMYYNRREPVSSVPSHRVLAIRRGCKEGVLVSSIEGDNAKAIDYLLSSVLKNKDDGESEFFPIIEAAVRESYNRMLRPMIETEVRTQLKERADREAIKVFQDNLTSLLLAPPSGPIVVMGVDMGKGRECNVAVVDETGRFLEGSKIRLTGKPAVSVVSAKAVEKADVPAVNVESAEVVVGTAAESAVDPFEAAQTDVMEEAAAESAAEPTEPAQVDDTEEAAVEPDNATAEITQVDSAEEAAAEPDNVTAEIIQADSAEEAAAESAAEPTEPAQVDVMEEAAAEPDNATAAITQVDSAEEAAAELDNATAEITQADSAEEATEEPAAELAEAVPADPSEAAAAEITGEDAPANPLAALLSSLTAPVAKAFNAPAAVAKAAVDPRIVLKNLIARRNVRAVAIGAGANARELENLLRQALEGEETADVFIAAVNDAGLAVYSSSRLAREEFPNCSASMRCAVSLARRLQDPLSEMVKLDPKLIGVGQYQHDVDQKELHRALAQTVQFCVNNVGVNLNAAGAPLLRYVSGLNDKLARRIVAVRASQGAFASRAAMNDALKLEPAVYEQTAAFLRITDGVNALDRTAIHPESYPVVERIAEAAGVSVGDLIGNRELVEAIDMQAYVTETTGPATLSDIREELLHPGRDPRRAFKLPKFNAKVRELSDLKPGMTLEGIVTNVTNFGAFVDIGVRQDGLVHLSQMSSHFIRDPREAVKVGDVVDVRVISVDSETKRIGLSMKINAPSGSRRKRQRRPRPDGKTQPRAQGSAGESGRPARPAKEAGGEGEAPSGRRERSPRPGGRNAAPRRDGKRQPRRPERAAEQFFETSSAEQTPAEPVYEGPEPSFEEKIAILQSKFRGIK